jgi:D-3-phosphoglycerate dehydrogenase / 2-oxoglutarate reductase
MTHFADRLGASLQKRAQVLYIMRYVYKGGVTVKVLVTDEIAEEGLQVLRRLENIDIVVRTGLSESELLQEIADADALLVRSQTQVTDRVIAAGAKLRAIGRAGVGVDNIDVNAATRRGVVVVNAPDGNTIAAAEHTLAMLLALARHIPQAYVSVCDGKWSRGRFVGVELRGKTLAVVGMGRIGTEVAKRALAFQMNVLGYDPYLTDERAESLGIQRVTLDEAIAHADFITVHTPLLKETHHLLDVNAFDKMKPGVRIINCARGGIIDEKALVEALQIGKVAGAALDVFEQEPLPADHPLRACENVILTPHLGASTVEAQSLVAVAVAEEVVNILTDKPFRNAVNLPSMTEEQKRNLQPYLTLGEKLGKFVGQLLLHPSVQVDITYSGDIANHDVSLLTRTVLKGLLAQTYADEVNFINALVVAKEKGIHVREVRQSSKVFTNMISVTAATKEEQHTVSGTLYNGYGPKIVEIDGFRIDVAPEGNLLYTLHRDKPGMIGKIGTLIGDAAINIAGMQVGRHEQGGDAVMLLSVDKAIPADIVERVRQIPDLVQVRSIEL